MLRAVVIALAIYALAGLILVGSVAYVFGGSHVTPAFRAVIGMGLTLNLVWTIGCGAFMTAFRDQARAAVRRIQLPWKVKFVLFATLLALAEEVVTVSLTNLAPLYGVKIGEAYITASTNYLDVVALHSVVVFIPMFACWAWLLSRYDFPPVVVMLLFGATGNLIEAHGLNNLFAGFWIFLYGWMVFLPAYSIPEDRGAKPPRWTHGVLAVFLPILCALPVVGIVHFLHPVSIHFPPIRA
jgi:hypothetical protein